MGTDGGLNIAGDLFGSTFGVNKNVQLVDAPGRSEDGAGGDDIFELTHDVFNLLGGNVAARGGGLIQCKVQSRILLNKLLSKVFLLIVTQISVFGGNNVVT